MELSAFDQSKTFEYHQGMIADRDRVESYRAAIREIVRPGDVVVDLGTGTGLLAYFACQAGAERVYGIERGPVVHVAEEMCRANGFEGRVTFIREDSRRVELPERADVLLSETLWNFGVGEGIVGSILDARERFLKPGGRVLPRAFEMLAAPAEAPQAHRRIAVEPADGYDLDFSVLRRYASNNIYSTRMPAESLLSAPVTLQRFDLLGDAPTDASGSGAAEVTRDGTVHGLVGWFSAELSESVTLANPPSDRPSSWSHAFMPVEPPVPVQEGARVDIRVQTSANGSVWRWTTEISAAGDGADVESMDATTFFGFPFEAEAGMKDRAPG